MAVDLTTVLAERDILGVCVYHISEELRLLELTATVYDAEEFEFLDDKVKRKVLPSVLVFVDNAEVEDVNQGQGWSISLEIEVMHDLTRDKTVSPYQKLRGRIWNWLHESFCDLDGVLRVDEISQRLEMDEENGIASTVFSTKIFYHQFLTHGI